MGYPRTMGAGLAGSTTKLYGNANVNQIQYGNKLQGLPPVTGRRDPYRVYKRKAGGNAPGRFRVFCINQLGGIGMGNKNSQFAPNADGLGWCPNRRNSRQGDIGINIADRSNDAIRTQSREDIKDEFDINIDIPTSVDSTWDTHQKNEDDDKKLVYGYEIAASFTEEQISSIINSIAQNGTSGQSDVDEVLNKIDANNDGFLSTDEVTGITVAVGSALGCLSTDCDRSSACSGPGISCEKDKDCWSGWCANKICRAYPPQGYGDWCGRESTKCNGVPGLTCRFIAGKGIYPSECGGQCSIAKSGAQEEGDYCNGNDDCWSHWCLANKTCGACPTQGYGAWCGKGCPHCCLLYTSPSPRD